MGGRRRRSGSLLADYGDRKHFISANLVDCCDDFFPFFLEYFVYAFRKPTNCRHHVGYTLKPAFGAVFLQLSCIGKE